MQINCPKCGNNSFKIVTDNGSKPVAECTKCSALMPFDEAAMKPGRKPKAPEPGQRSDTKLESQA